VQRCWDRHDRLSVVGAITISPQRKQLDLRFSFWHENICTKHIVQFLKQVRYELRSPIVVILDRLSAHRSAAKQLRSGGCRNITFEWLPAYAPDLNPVEALWSHTKYSDLANFLPNDQHQLRRSVCQSINAKRRQKQLLRSFIHTAGLKL